MQWLHWLALGMIAVMPLVVFGITYLEVGRK
ncbi:hypothetical protein FHW03_000848 [Ochrobactrum sp. RH2CCR150]|nr:hypothetical protein [Ochrobactrum sp. RH2CCR150]